MDAASGQAKIATLQEELKKARSYARTLGILSIFFVMLMIVGFVITFFYPEFGARIGAPILGILGAIFFPLGAIGEWRANKTKMNLIRKLEEMSIKFLACPNCNKEVLQGAFEVCPFCGKPLRQ
jgi:hypothetical protein